MPLSRDLDLMSAGFHVATEARGPGAAYRAKRPAQMLDELERGNVYMHMAGRAAQRGSRR